MPDDDKTDKTSNSSPVDLEAFSKTILAAVQTQVGKMLEPLSQAISGLSDSHKATTTTLTELGEKVTGLQPKVDDKKKPATTRRARKVAAKAEDTDDTDADADTVEVEDDPRILTMQETLTKIERANARLEKEVADARAREQKMLEEKRATDRRARLVSALSNKELLDAEVVDIEGGLRHFAPDIRWSEKLQQDVYFDAKTQTELPLEDGLKANLPTYLKKSAMTTGGSGGQGSTVGGGTPAGGDSTKLTEDRVIQVGIRAKQSRDIGDLANFARLKTELKAQGGNLARVTDEVTRAS